MSPAAEPAAERAAERAAPAGLETRLLARALLGEVLHRRRALDEALAADVRLATLAARDRAFVRHLVATTLRRLGEIDALVAGVLEHPLDARAQATTDTLRIAVAQLAFLGTPAHAVVDTAVAAVAAIRGGAHKGLVNAVLRRLAREHAGRAATADAVRLDTPAWLLDSWTAAYGEDTARAIAAAHLGEPPLDLTCPADIETWAARLGGTRIGPVTIRLAASTAVAELAGYAEGAWWVQDVAAALPARLIADAVPGGLAGARIADLCAAPGGKTAQLAALGARVTAVDRAAPRIERTAANLARLRLAAEFVVADASRWRPAAPFAAVLLDAPCSGTGTIRRHPDIAHLKAPADVARLAGVQDRLLAAAAHVVAPGGILVYSVCSLEPAEGPDRIAAFLAAHPAFARLPVPAAAVVECPEAVTPEGDVRTLPCLRAAEGGMDGFFIARLRRAA